jgi:hypothetical protein
VEGGINKGGCVTLQMGTMWAQREAARAGRGQGIYRIG